MGQWSIYSLVSLVVSFLVGYVLYWLWFFFRLIILGYGDSGPHWIIVVNNIILFGGMSIAFIGCQVFYFIKLKKKKDPGVR